MPPEILGSIAPQLISAGVIGALSPVAALAAIMLLSTRRPIANTVAYLAGWTIVLMVLAAGLALLLHGHEGASGKSAKAMVELVVGLILIGAGLRSFIGERHPMLRPAIGQHPTEAPARAPGWLRKLETVNVLEAFAVGMIIILISPADLAAYFAGLQALLGDDSSSTAKVALAAVLLVAIDSCILIPLLVYVMFPRRAAGWLATGKDWLITNNRIVTAASSALFGALLLGSGIVALL